MGKFRTKSVVKDALLWDGQDHRAMFDFLDGSSDELISCDGENFYIDHGKVQGGLMIKSIEGDHKADIGDYIIKSLKGEFYVCKPDIFHMTYEAVVSNE